MKKRLLLKKETLRSLQAVTLRWAKGETGDSIEHSCDCQSEGPACTLPQTAAFMTCACSLQCYTMYC
jgi:hypothetical protein